VGQFELGELHGEDVTLACLQFTVTNVKMLYTLTVPSILAPYASCGSSAYSFEPRGAEHPPSPFPSLHTNPSPSFSPLSLPSLPLSSLCPFTSFYDKYGSGINPAKIACGALET